MIGRFGSLGSSVGWRNWTFLPTGARPPCERVCSFVLRRYSAARLEPLLEKSSQHRTSARVAKLAQSLRLDLTNSLSSDVEVIPHLFEGVLRSLVDSEAHLQHSGFPVGQRRENFAGVVGEYYPDALLTVEGFTDPSGSETYNLALGQRRAEAVQRYLVESEDFTPDHVRAVSYGEDSRRLVAPGQSGELAGWENRRVVLVIEHVGYEANPTIVDGGE